MTRLNGLLEQQLQARLTAIEQQMAEIKNKQFAGSSNLLTERYASEDDYDFAVSLAVNSATGWEVAIPARDPTFNGDPFVWQVFFDIVNSPPNMNFSTFSYVFLPADGEQKYRMYFYSDDGTSLPETIQIKVVVYGINIGAFSVSQIL